MCGVVYLTKILLFSLAADILTFSPQLFCALHDSALNWLHQELQQLFLSSSLLCGALNRLKGSFFPLLLFEFSTRRWQSQLTCKKWLSQMSVWRRRRKKWGRRKIHKLASERSQLTAESERWECINDAITDSSCAPVYILLCFSASHFHFRFDYYCKTASVFARCARSLPSAERKREI